MILSFCAHVAHREIQGIGYQSTLSDSPSGDPSNGSSFGILLTNHSCELLFHEGAHLRISQRLAIVAIEWGQPATRPGERLRRLKFDALHLEQLLCKLGSDGRHIRLILSE